MLLTDVTTLAEVMALSYDMDDDTPYAFAGFGNYTQREVPGKRMINAAGLELVSDATAANGVQFLRVLTAPNMGEAGYGFQNIASLFPADIYPDFWTEFYIRGAAGEMGTPFVTVQSPNYFNGVGIYRDGGTGKYMLDAADLNFASYPDGIELSPATDPTDLIFVTMHFQLTNPTPANLETNPAKAAFGMYWSTIYDVSVTVTLAVNGVQTGDVTVVGSAKAARFVEGDGDPLTSLPGELAPWQLICPHETFPTIGTQEIHGWEFLVDESLLVDAGVPQWGGVTAYTHTLSGGSMRTNVELAGQPKGGFKRWRPLGQKRPPTLPNAPIGDPQVPGGIQGFTIVESRPIAAAAFTDTTSLIPAGATIFSVSVLVTTAIPGPTTSFSVGDAGNTTRYSTADVSPALGGFDAGTKAGAYYNATATAVRLTMNGGNPATDTGVVRVTISYSTVTG